MLFMRMHSKEITKSLGKCMLINELLTYYRKSGSPDRVAGQIFDLKPLIAISVRVQRKYAYNL